MNQKITAISKAARKFANNEAAATVENNNQIKRS